MLDQKEIFIKRKEKIALKEINRILRKGGIGINCDEMDLMPWCAIYHKRDWDHGYETNYGCNASRRVFYKDMQSIIEFLEEYFLEKEIDELIIAPCHNIYQFEHNAKWDDSNFDIYEEIYDWLRLNNIRYGERSGIKVNIKEDIDMIEMILEGAFRGVSKLCFLLYSNDILLVPTHHFSITFYSRYIKKEKELIRMILKKYSDLAYCEE